MRIDVSARIDGRLESLVVASARRRSTVLRLVPARWLGPVVTPTVMRLRRLLAGAALAAVLLAGATSILVIVTP